MKTTTIQTVLHDKTADTAAAVHVWTITALSCVVQTTNPSRFYDAATFLTTPVGNSGSTLDKAIPVFVPYADKMLAVPSLPKKTQRPTLRIPTEQVVRIRQDDPMVRRPIRIFHSLDGVGSWHCTFLGGLVRFGVRMHGTGVTGTIMRMMRKRRKQQQQPDGKHMKRIDCWHHPQLHRPIRCRIRVFSGPDIVIVRMIRMMMILWACVYDSWCCSCSIDWYSVCVCVGFFPKECVYHSKECHTHTEGQKLPPGRSKRGMVVLVVMTGSSPHQQTNIHTQTTVHNVPYNNTFHSHEQNNSH